MSADRCRFSLIQYGDDYAEDSKDMVLFKIPLDTDVPDEIKTDIKAKKLRKTTTEDVLVNVQEFN